ncbi:MAG: class I SAM-dependent RNA methyltransferase, partial [Rhizobacter sp.]
IACGIAPGLKRRFAFERLLPFVGDEQRAELQRLRSHAQARIHPSAVPIYASDVSFRMVDFARRNAQRAGVEAAITFNGGDALERPAPALPDGLPGTLMINPPYGERIEVGGKAARASAEDRDTPSDFFPRLASHWKRAYTQHAAGWTAYVLSPDMKLPSAMRLKESRRVPMWNGPIECRLFRFDLVAGSARNKV